MAHLTNDEKVKWARAFEKRIADAKDAIESGEGFLSEQQRYEEYAIWLYSIVHGSHE